METDKQLDNQIKEILQRLEEATNNSKQYYLVNEIVDQKRFADLFEVALAFDTVSLLETQYEILLAKRYKHKGWEKVIESFEIIKLGLEKRIAHLKKRDLPPWT